MNKQLWLRQQLWCELLSSNLIPNLFCISIFPCFDTFPSQRQNHFYDEGMHAYALFQGKLKKHVIYCIFLLFTFFLLLQFLSGLIFRQIFLRPPSHRETDQQLNSFARFSYCPLDGRLIKQKSAFLIVLFLLRSSLKVILTIWAHSFCTATHFFLCPNYIPKSARRACTQAKGTSAANFWFGQWENEDEIRSFQFKSIIEPAILSENFASNIPAISWFDLSQNHKCLLSTPGTAPKTHPFVVIF